MSTSRKLSDSLHQDSGRNNGHLLPPFFSCWLSLSSHNPAFASFYLWCCSLENCLWSWLLTPVSLLTPYTYRWAQVTVDYGFWQLLPWPLFFFFHLGNLFTLNSFLKHVAGVYSQAISPHLKCNMLKMWTLKLVFPSLLAVSNIRVS